MYFCNARQCSNSTPFSPICPPPKKKKITRWNRLIWSKIYLREQMWQNKTHSFPWRAAKNNIGSAGMWSSEEFATWMSQNGDSIFTSSVNRKHILLEHQILLQWPTYTGLYQSALQVLRQSGKRVMASSSLRSWAELRWRPKGHLEVYVKTDTCVHVSEIRS